MRQLVTYRVIDAILPHPNADRLEIAILGGWRCVVGKGQFSPKETVLYFEPDSLLPVHPVFEFLRKSCFIDKPWATGFRLRTIRLRGEISQGLIQPLSILDSFPVADTLEEMLGVTLYDPPVPAQIAGQMAGNFPTHLCPKSDQERIQNIDLASYVGPLYEVTEKMDGSSMTVILHDGKMRVCSRNYELKDTSDNTLWSVAKTVFANVPNDLDLAFQGELTGPGIQGNPYGFHRPMFFLYNVYDIARRRWMSHPERMEIASKYGISHVPLIGIQDVTTMEEILAQADGVSRYNGVAREGLVFKTLDGQRSFKAISNEWLVHDTH